MLLFKVGDIGRAKVRVLLTARSVVGRLASSSQTFFALGRLLHCLYAKPISTGIKSCINLWPSLAPGI